MTIQYRLPELLSLHILPQYTKPNNANFQQLEAAYVAWIDKADFLSAPHKEAWKKAELALLISRAFPDSDMAPLRVCLDWMMLFLILERLTDAPASSADSRRWASLYVKILSGTEIEEELPGAAKVIKFLTRKIMPKIEDEYKAAFIASNQTLADGVVQEAIDRESPRQVSLRSYIETRRNSIGVKPFLNLARWTFAVDLQPDVLKHPILMEMETATVDLIAFANDIYSYRKEFLEDGALHNFVTVAMKDPSVPIPDGDYQAAIDYTTEKFASILERFVECRELIVSLFPSERVKLERYVESMLDLVVGNIQWSISCKRYSLFEDEETKRTRIITIPLSQ